MNAQVAFSYVHHFLGYVHDEIHLRKVLYHLSVMPKPETDRQRHYASQILITAVRERLALPESSRCMLFPSEEAMKRFLSSLRDQNARNSAASILFYVPPALLPPQAPWDRFFAVVYHQDFHAEARRCCAAMGIDGGLSSQQTEFCAEYIHCMPSISSNPAFTTLGSRSSHHPMPPQSRATPKM